MFIYIAIIVLLIYLYFKRLYSYWDNLGFPYIPPKFPMGSMSTVGWKEHTCDFFKREYENYKDKGPAFGMFFLTQIQIIITDPELIKEVYARNFETFHERGMYVNEKDDPLFNNLFTLSGQAWKDMRAKLSPTFTSGRMKMMFPNVIQKADHMINYLKPFAENSEPLEMKEVFASFTTEVIADVAFGLETECLGKPDCEFRVMAKTVFEPTAWENMQIFFAFACPKITQFLGITFTPRKTTEFFMRIIRETMEYREKNKIERNDFLQLLMNIRDSEEGMTFNEIAANSFIFFSAGFETSSSVLTFTSYELALNPDIQETLRDEINEILAQHNGEVTYDAIMEMKYLDMVFNETLRKYPVIDTQIRKSVKEFKIPNTNLVIPANIGVAIPTYAIQNDEKYFPNPNKFDPERFTDENVKKQTPYTYIPFSEGPRQCIGLRFGTMQTKVGLVKLLKNYSILPCSKTIIPMKFKPTSAFMNPLNGMWLKLEKL